MNPPIADAVVAQVEGSICKDMPLDDDVTFPWMLRKGRDQPLKGRRGEMKDHLDGAHDMVFPVPYKGGARSYGFPYLNSRQLSVVNQVKPSDGSVGKQ